MSNLKRVTPITLIFAVIGLFMFTALPVWAVPPDCTRTDTGAGEKDPLKRCEEKLNEAQSELLIELDRFVGEMEATQGIDLKAMSFTNARTGESSDLREHMAKMGREHTRAKNAIKESVNEDFEEIVASGGKQKGQKCDWKETDDVVNNPDDYVPAELDPPGIGLGDGECNKFKAYDPAKGKDVWINERLQTNICIRVCGDRFVPDDPDASSVSASNKPKKKDKIRGRHTARRDESIDATLRATDALYSGFKEMEKINVMSKAYGPAFAFEMTFPECARPLDVPHTATWATKVVLVPVLVGLKITTRVVSGMADSGKVFCQQDVAGFNASSACIPAIVAKEIAQGSVDVVEFLIQAADLTNEGFEIFTGDATHDCVTSIRTKQAEMMGLVKGIDTKVNNLKTQVGNMADGLEAQIKENRDLIIENQDYIRNTREIVLTPHGQRNRVDLYEPEPDDQ